MHYESDRIKDKTKEEGIILQQRCNYFEYDKNDKNVFYMIGINDNNLIDSFVNFNIKYKSLLVKTLNILN